MNNKLTISSRILIAFASGALVAVFFLPAWRIDLFAPQYPEGLTMNIWINNITGDVDVINGLNHYIGMKHITVGMFPEFKFLPYVVGLFMVLGMAVAITGNKKLLLVYLGLTIAGGALAMYDFYQWGYNYGHDLDPTAPIQVPGLSYQPPLFGHKRLLNFDAYSFPDTGGWIVIAAAGLAFAVWFAEWYRVRKETVAGKRVAVVALTIVFFLVSSCSDGPEPFRYGTDTCHACKMGIIDPKFGCQVVTARGKIYKFDDLLCMGNFLRDGQLGPEDIKTMVVLDFLNKDKFLDVNTASFLSGVFIKSPMGGNTAAFADRKEAEKMNDRQQGRVINWNELYNTLGKDR